jgi:membrane protein
MSIRTSFRILIRAARQFDAHGASQMGAALSYYALFSIAPMLVIAVSVAGTLFGKEAAVARVEQHLTEVFGPESARELVGLMGAAYQPAGGTVATVLGIVTMIIAALGVFLHVRRCLHIIWQLEAPKMHGILTTLLNYALAVAMVLCTSILLLISLAISTAMPSVRKLLSDYVPGTGTIWQWIEAGISFLLLALFFALIFRIMSSRRIAWGYVWYGSFVTSLLFTIGKTLIGLYLAHTSTKSAYGAAGSLVVFLVWVYYTSQITFFGAELIQARRTRSEWLPPSKSS